MPEPRAPFGGMTEAEIKQIAEMAAVKALEHVYAEVGKGVLRKMAWLIGAAVVGLAIFLASKNALPIK